MKILLILLLPILSFSQITSNKKSIPVKVIVGDSYLSLSAIGFSYPSYADSESSLIVDKDLNEIAKITTTISPDYLLLLIEPQKTKDPIAYVVPTSEFKFHSNIGAYDVYAYQTPDQKTQIIKIDGKYHIVRAPGKTLTGSDCTYYFPDYGKLIKEWSLSFAP